MLRTFEALMQRMFLLAMAICFTFVTGMSLTAGEQPKRQPVPSKAALDKAEDLVNDIFKEDISKASDAETRSKLAIYLAQQGDESGDDPAARYVLYCQARDLAVLAGNAQLAMSAIDKLTQFFELAGLELKAEALAKLVTHLPDREQSKGVAEIALALAGEALEADDYDAAAALGNVAAAAAKKAQIVALATTAAKRNAEIQAAKEKFGVLQPYVDRLAKDANDAEANLKLGEYFGLFKGKWDRAMPHLAKSKSEPLASLAREDLAIPKDAAAQAALADAWWDFAAKQGEPQQARLQERAAYWYEKALPQLSGLSRTKAQKRLAQTSTRRGGLSSPVVEGPVGFLRTLEGHNGEVRSVAISDDGRFGLSGSVDGSVRLWELETGKEIKSFRGHSKQVWAVAFLPGGKHLASGSWDGTVRIWDEASGNLVRSIAHPLDVNGIAISRDGKWMLTACDDKSMRLWDLTTYAEVKRFPPHANFCYACAFAPNGLQVASGSVDRRAMVFELATGKLVREVEQTNAVSCVAFSPDSKYLFTCGDNAAHMWDVSNGNQEKRFESAGGYVTSMGLTPDGKRLVTGGEDKLVHVWDVATGKEVTRFPGHTGTITALAVSSDGRRALTGQIDGSIRYWALPTN
jgi:WD40 repeat protein